MAANQELKKRIDDLQTIRGIGLQVTGFRTLEEVLDHIMGAAREISGADDSVIFLYEFGNLDQGVIWDFEDNLPFNIRKLKIGGDTYFVKNQGNIKLVDESSLHPVFMYPDFRGSIYEFDLKIEDIVIGSLTIGFRKSHHLSQSKKDVIRMLVDQAAIAIENTRLLKIDRTVAIIDERHRLARELHDSIAQALYGITLYAKASGRKRRDQSSDISRNIETIQKTALEALKEMRLLLFEMRPPQLEHQGLVPALAARLESVEERSGLVVDFSIDGDLDLPDLVEDVFYRISLESLNNILKHAQASRVELRIKNKPSGIELMIKDDGQGFSLDQLESSRGLGITGMKERAEKIGAEINIDSKPGEGTTILVEVEHE